MNERVSETMSARGVFGNKTFFRASPWSDTWRSQMHRDSMYGDGDAFIDSMEIMDVPGAAWTLHSCIEMEIHRDPSMEISKKTP